MLTEGTSREGLFLAHTMTVLGRHATVTEARGKPTVGIVRAFTALDDSSFSTIRRAEATYHRPCVDSNPE
jgi:hypothetical protein